MAGQEVLEESERYKWSQGCLLKAASIKLPWLALNIDEVVSPDHQGAANSVGSTLEWKIEHRTLESEDFLVVVSQTCDIRRSANKEPYIEAIRAFWTDDKGLINEARTNSIRHFPLLFREVDGKRLALIADATLRVLLDKASLLSLEPVVCFKEDDKITPLHFRRWLTERYGRQAVPDEYVNAIQKPIVKAVRKLKSTSELFHILEGIWRVQYFVRDEESPYQVDMFFIRTDRRDATPVEGEGWAKLADWISTVLSDVGEAELAYWESPDTKNTSLYDFLHSYELPLDSYTLSGEYEDS